jgi:hypothetical protein
MQTKLQTIIFFTFLICVQISFTSSLKLKTKVNSFLQIGQAIATDDNTNATADNTIATDDNTNAIADNTIATDDNTNATADNTIATADNTNATASITTENSEEDIPHHEQYHIHHVVPKNLTETNHKLSSRLDQAHRRLDEMDDLRKENEERKLLEQLPSLPEGIVSVGVYNLELKHVSKQSNNFNITDIRSFAQAFKQAQSEKTRRVSVNNQTYVIREINNNIWYGAIVGAGGIAVYRKGEYLLCVVHDQKITLLNFAKYFQNLKHSFEDHKEELKVVYIKDKNQERQDNLKDRLKTDKVRYQEKKEDKKDKNYNEHQNISKNI